VSEDDEVIAPGGPRPRSSVHEVAPGQAVRRTAEGTYVVENAGAAEEHVLTPGGLRPKSLVHTVEPGHTVDVAEGRLRVMHPSGEVVADLGALPLRVAGRPLMPRNVVAPPAPEEVVPAFGSGWITYASWTNSTGTPVSRFATTWVVPPAPSTDSGQTIFLFNGIQNSTNIYQPVLQWGPSAAGGGSFWSVASWYVDGAGGAAFNTNLVRVNEGDVLTGVMTLTGQSAAGFSYDCVFQGIANTSLPVQNIQELTWLIETLECYGITQCSDYPATSKTAMASIAIQTANTSPAVTWTVNNAVTDCGQHTLIFSEETGGSGEVDLWYANSPFWTSGFGTLAPGASQDWWFSWGGVGDVGPQLIQAEPLEISGELATVQIAESLDSGGHLTYFATVHNNGPTPVRFQWRGGGR
jgi:hypothetical protein